jgi:hypothetical protein
MHKARILINRKEVLEDGAIIQAVVWELPVPLPGSWHHYKYRFYFGKDGVALVRYDNERGKGDHRHYGNSEEPYAFAGLEELYRDFIRDVKRCLEQECV